MPSLHFKRNGLYKDVITNKQGSLEHIFKLPTTALIIDFNIIATYIYVNINNTFNHLFIYFIGLLGSIF